MFPYILQCVYVISPSIAEVDCECNLTAEVDCPEATRGNIAEARVANLGIHGNMDVPQLSVLALSHF
jgi:hypothetical protein